MKTIAQRVSRHGVAAALGAIALGAGCSSSSAGSGFVDPPEDAGDDGPTSYSSSSGASPDASSSSGSSADASDGGGGAKGPSCHGTPASCSSAASENACNALGCTWGGMCTGTALPCAGLDQSKCGIQQNCVYDSSSFQCSGTVFACAVLSAAYGCTTQQGCAWVTDCSGTATIACTSLSASASCTAAGCVWD